MFAKMIEITTRIGCALNCRFCPQERLISAYRSSGGDTPAHESHAGRRPAMMTLETFRRCIDKIPAEVDIHFSGMCEPWLNPDCTEMLKYAWASGHNVQVFTSLAGMSQSDYLAVRECTPSYVAIHIPDAKGNCGFVISEDYLRLLALAVSDAIRGAFRIDSFSCHGTVHPAVKDLVGMTRIKVNTQLNDRAGNVSDGPDWEQVCKLPRKLEGRIGCRWCRGTSLDKNVLLPDGTVLLCCMDYGMEFPLGNLLRQSFQEISEGRRKKEYREMMASEEKGTILCRYCSRAVSLRNGA